MTPTTLKTRYRLNLRRSTCATLAMLLCAQLTAAAHPASASDQKASSIQIGTTIEEAEVIFFGSTVLYLSETDEGDVTEIEYTDQAGNVYLWHPGIQEVQKGLLEFRGAGIGLETCFHYGENDQQPSIENRGIWNCFSREEQISTIKDIEKGDVFHLASHKNVPHLLNYNDALPYISKNPEAKFPFLTNGKTPIENLQTQWLTNTHKPKAR